MLDYPLDNVTRPLTGLGSPVGRACPLYRPPIVKLAARKERGFVKLNSAGSVCKSEVKGYNGVGINEKFAPI
jgi:hypothetical protein